MKKVILALLLLKIIASIVFLYALDIIATRAFNHYGSKIIGMQVHVDDVAVSLLHSTVTINNLLVQSPKGFSNPYVLDLKTISVKMDVMSMLKDVVRINSIIIDSPIVIYEVGPDGDNIGLIKKNIATFGKEPTTFEESNITEKKSNKKVVIDDLKIKSAKVTADLAQLATQSLSIADIELKQIGYPSGISFDAAVNIVMGELSKELVRSGVQALLAKHLDPNKLLEKLKSKVDNAKQQGVDKLEESLNKFTNKLLNQQ